MVLLDMKNPKSCRNCPLATIDRIEKVLICKVDGHGIVDHKLKENCPIKGEVSNVTQ